MNIQNMICDYRKEILKTFLAYSVYKNSKMRMFSLISDESAQLPPVIFSDSF